MKGLISLLLSALMLTFVLTGCTTLTSPNDAQPVNMPNNEPVTLTLLCYWREASAKAFSAAIHEKLPHITVEYEFCPIGALPYADEVTRRVMHDMESDIFMTMDTKLWNSGKLLNLTDEDFVSRYNLSIMKTLSGDGSVYFVPSVGDVWCYIYNTQWLSELGLPSPQTIGALNDTFSAVSKAGKQPFVVPYSQMPTQYVKVLLSGYLSTPKGQQWLSDYNQGKTTMSQDVKWQQLWKQIEEMTQKGYLRPEDMLYSEARRIAFVQDEGGFMTTFSSMQDSNFSAQRKEALRILPLLGEKPENQMVYTAPTYYFALSHKLSTPENKAKRAAALQVLDFLSTPEGQILLCDKSPLAISYLSNTTLPIDDKYSNLAEIIKKGSFTQIPMFERGVEPVIEGVFKELVEGKITADEAIFTCDRQNADYIKRPAPTFPVIGTAAELFPWLYVKSRTEELEITNFCVDSMRKAAETDYALELGTAFRGEFFKGDITTADVESVIRQDKKVFIVEVTGQQIWTILEQGVLKANSSWFIVPSGFRYSYQSATSDTAGKLLKVTLEDGTPLDLEKNYTVAVSENQMAKITDVFSFFDVAGKELPFTLREAVTRNIREQGVISPKMDGRIGIAP